MADFLLEIGAEEIPDWMIQTALTDLRDRFQSEFGAFGGDALQTYGTPRRLVLVAENILPQAPDAQTLVQGPYLSAGSKAAEGFARKNAVSVDELEKITDAKGDRYVSRQHVKGQTAAEALGTKLPELIAGIRFPKAMYWTGKGGLRFIRPIRWIVALLDSGVVPFEIAGVKSGNETRGHRILGSPNPLQVSTDTYKQVLRENFVIVDESERKTRIESGFVNGVEPDYDLIRTLVYMTEFPTPVRGSFDSAYLELPQEILSTVMRHHQRYFSVHKPDGCLAPEFLAITNTNGDPDGLIRQGNERVVRARFNDARFFWQVDQKKKLANRVPELANVTFQAKLGTYADKTERVRKLSSEIAAELGANLPVVDRAALLLKTDLTTDMVKEFTELQGVVGGLYAKAQGETEAVATAIYDQYKPVSMEDSIPRTLEGQIVSIADKLDTLRECFRIGLLPTGSKDPFALRRAAQGIVKILFEARLPFAIMKFVEGIAELEPFLLERIDFYLREILNFAYDEVKAVLAAPVSTLANVADRVDAIHYIRPTEDFEPLAASFKRIKNILRQAESSRFDFGSDLLNTSLVGSAPPDPARLTAGPELDLYNDFLRVRQEANHSASYREKLVAIASLRPMVDLFFDKILVNDPDLEIRKNRLALLHSLLTEFSTIADFSEIVTQGTIA